MVASAPAQRTAEIREQIGQERLLHLYRQMLLIRRFEERSIAAYQQKKIAGFLHPYIGTEAVATGIYAHLDPAIDPTVTSYRCHAHALLLDIDPKELMAELFGKITGNVRGKGGSMHFFSKEKNFLGGHGIVGGQIPVGTGGAFAAKYRETGGVSVSFFGDGASAQGTFHESLNMASLWDLPAIYVVENNQWGMGTSCARAVAVDMIAESRAQGYGVKGFTLDGTDLFDVWAQCKEIIEYVRRESRPVFIEAKTVRFIGHSLSDSQPYRSRDDINQLRESKDPIDKVAAQLIDAGWASEDDLEEMNEEIMERIMEAVQFADESPEPPMSELMRHVLVED